MTGQRAPRQEPPNIANCVSGRAVRAATMDKEVKKMNWVQNLLGSASVADILVYAAIIAILCWASPSA